MAHVRPFEDLQEEGLLWLINRVVFHPRGYALGFHKDDDGNVIGWEMLGDGEEVWNFTEETDDQMFERVNNYLLSP